MAVYVVRHAESVWNPPPKRFQGRADVELSDVGQCQIRDYPCNLPEFDAAFSSPARRCRDTIDALLQSVANPPAVQEDDRLWEIDNGWFSGLTGNDVNDRDAEHFEAWMKVPHLVRPGSGELISEMAARIQSAFTGIVSQFGSPGAGHALVVTHGGPIRTLICLVDEIPLAQFHQISVGNLSTFVLDVDGSAWSLSALGPDRQFGARNVKFDQSLLEIMKDQESVTLQILSRFREEFGLPDLEADQSLFSSGPLDSLELFNVVTILEAEYGLKIPPFDVSLESFDDVGSISKYVCSKLEA